jgi:parvulin-like peptidyl-prolyl isomerase
MFNKKKSKKKESLGRIGRVEREHRYNQAIKITTYVVVGLVLIVALAGILINTVFIPNSTIVTINGKAILTRDFQKRVQMDRDRLVSEYGMYQQFAMTLTDPDQQQQYLYYLSQIEAQLVTEDVGQSVMNQMIDEYFIVEEAKARGITVTDEEVEEYFNSLFGYYPDGVPTPVVTEALPTSTLSPTQLAIITPTPAPEGSDDVVETSGDQPLPTSVSQEDFETNLEGYLDRMKPYGVDADYLKELIKIQLFREKLDEDLRKGISAPTQEQVWARHILVEDLESAEDLLEQLNDGGDFGDLAREFSTGPSGVNGGDLGWFGRGQMVTEFEEAAFSGEVGEIVGPVQTNFGFHLIQIVGKEEFPADETTIDTLVYTALSDLLNAYKEEADIVFAENWIDRTPNEPDIIRMAEQPVQ